MRVVLASKSPRRRELLGELFNEFEIITAEVDETLGEGIELSSGVRILAERKGKPVSEMLGEDVLVISSDTLVELDGEALGKPLDAKDAERMLKALSGREHNVHTGIAVHYGGSCFSGTATSTVHFRELSKHEIEEYIASGEPMDKAGAYGIQGAAGKFVSRYDGDFDTIVGLSVRLTKSLIDEAITAFGDKND